MLPCFLMPALSSPGSDGHWRFTIAISPCRVWFMCMFCEHVPMYVAWPRATCSAVRSGSAAIKMAYSGGVSVSLHSYNQNSVCTCATHSVQQLCITVCVG